MAYELVRFHHACLQCWQDLTSTCDTAMGPPRTSHGFQVYLSMRLCVHDGKEGTVDLYRAQGRSHGDAFVLIWFTHATGIACFALQQACPWLCCIQELHILVHTLYADTLKRIGSCIKRKQQANSARL